VEKAYEAVSPSRARHDSRELIPVITWRLGGPVF